MSQRGIHRESIPHFLSSRLINVVLSSQKGTAVQQRRIEELKTARDAWKAKLKGRQQEHKAFQKRIKELTRSRDSWNVKAQQKQTELEQTRQHLKETQQAFKQQRQASRPKRHHDSLLIIRLVLLIKLQTSTSFRAVGKIIVIVQLYFHLVTETPSAPTITNWVDKLGYYELTRPKEWAKDWVILLDHSIQLGQDTLFVVLGIRESQIDFTRPLRYTDLTPLIMTSKTSWKGTTVQQELTRLQRDIGQINYAVGDHAGE